MQVKLPPRSLEVLIWVLLSLEVEEILALFGQLDFQSEFLVGFLKLTVLECILLIFKVHFTCLFLCLHHFNF